MAKFRTDAKAESFTHADGVIGHFTVNSVVRGNAIINSNARQLIITEAKLGSSLSAGTKNAPTYDQAARNVAYIDHMLDAAHVDPASMESFAFYVIAPQSQIKAGVFADLVTKASIEAKVRDRVASYAGTHDEWLLEVFLPVLARIQLGLLSWEEILEVMPQTAEVDVIRAFYVQCLKCNPLRLRRELT